MEIRIDFGSKDDWLSWQCRNEDFLQAALKRILASIQARGFVEPITGRHVTAGEARIVPGNLRETIANGDLNARKRALLAEIEYLRRTVPRLSRPDCRIFAPEALSRSALILRGRYAFFLGTEYLPDPEKRARMFPIPHGDLCALDLPAEMFDLAYANDVLEQVGCLPAAIRELVRILAPDGFFLSAVPFDPNLSRTGGATADGSSSSAFGWDLLELCRDAGIRDARMTLYASSTYGVASNGTTGVFVLTGAKGPELRPARNWIWRAARIERLIGVVGLPRSGTTMFSAVLDAHDEVVSIYEPWNASKNKIAPEAITAGSLTAEAETQSPRASVLVIKETTLDPAYPTNLLRVLEEALPPFSRHLLLLLRNPFHCFLSEIEGRQKWWGEADLKPDIEAFERWAERTLQSYRQMLHLGTKAPSSFVFYESCVSNPVPTFGRVMERIGLRFTPDQLSITTNSDLRRVRGDVSLVENARDVSDASVEKRAAGLERLRGSLARSPLFRRIEQVSALFDHSAASGVIANGDDMWAAFTRSLSELTAESRP